MYFSIRPLIIAALISVLQVPILQASVLDMNSRYLDLGTLQTDLSTGLPGAWLRPLGALPDSSSDTSLTQVHIERGDYLYSAVDAQYITADGNTGFWMNSSSYSGYNSFSLDAYRFSGRFPKSVLNIEDRQGIFELYSASSPLMPRFEFRKRQAELSWSAGGDDPAFGLDMSGSWVQLHRSNMDARIDGTADISRFEIFPFLSAGSWKLGVRSVNTYWSHDSSDLVYLRSEALAEYRALSISAGTEDGTAFYKIELHGKIGDRTAFRTGAEPIFPRHDLMGLSHPLAEIRERIFAEGVLSRGDGALGLELSAGLGYVPGQVWATYYSAVQGNFVREAEDNAWSITADWKMDLDIKRINLFWKGRARLTRSFFDADYDPELLRHGAGADLNLQLFDGHMDLNIVPSADMALHYSAMSHYFSAAYMRWLPVYEASPTLIWDVYLNTLIRARVKTLEIEYEMNNILGRPSYTSFNGAPAARFFQLRIIWTWKN